MGACGLIKSKRNSDQIIKANPIENDQSLLDRIGAAQIEMLKTKFKQYAIDNSLDMQGFKKMMPYINKLPQNIIENAFYQFTGLLNDRIT